MSEKESVAEGQTAGKRDFTVASVKPCCSGLKLLSGTKQYMLSFSFTASLYICIAVGS